MESLEFFSSLKVPATVLHVLSVVFGMGSAIVSDILFTFYTRDKDLNDTELKTLKILSKTVWYSLIFIFLSGLLIFAGNIERYSASDKFLAKMSIMAVLVVNGFILDRYIWPHLKNKGFFTLDSEKKVRKVSFVCGTVSIVSWISVCTLGVLDSLSMPYASILGLYVLLLSFGIPVALFIEKKKFESN